MRPLGYNDPVRELEDRAAQKIEDRNDRKGQRDLQVDGIPSGLVRLGGLDPNDAEYETVETFADYLRDCDRTDFSCHELACLNIRTGLPSPDIKTALIVYGFQLRHRPFEKSVRGFSSNPNAGRYDGMHGGGGGSSINGFAGYAG